ncbi:MAG: phosphoribosylanthranilate isomerase [Halioglobus sp.]|nr:phosphoribosylanthranilate isomerase [Halioglobus sp.]|tara:strand:+ start:59 stop:712 length:654 start_codon:yes stop_codon:yes gene_type:complete
MTATRIKICGITREEDARAAADAGADAIGMVFYEPSPRNLSCQRAVQVADAVAPFVTLVGLFVDADAAVVRQTLRDVPLDVLQFQGSESPEYCAQFERPWVKALHVRPGARLEADAERYRAARALLLDSWQEGVPGGTGRTFDWSLAPARLPRPLVLAGGLDADNVGAAILGLRPAAVDVSSGVERSPGLKDARAIGQFVAAVRAADETMRQRQDDE